MTLVETAAPLTAPRLALRRAGDTVERVFLALPLPVLAFCGLFVLVAFNGLIGTGSLGTVLLYARHPFHPPFLHDRRYLLTSPLLPVIAHAVRADRSYTTMLVFHLTLVLALGGACIAYVRRTGGDLLARLVTTALFAGPLGGVLLAWLGLVDPLTFGCATVLAVARQRWLAFVAAVLVGVNHFEQGVVIVAVLAIVEFGDRYRSASWQLGLIRALGLACGRAIVWMYLAVFHIDASYDRRAWLQSRGVAHVAHDAVRGGVPLLLALFGGWWLFVVLAGRCAWRADRRVVIALVAAVSVAAALTTITADETRVFALVTWPLLVWFARWSLAHLDRQRVQRFAAWCLLLGALYPIRPQIYLGENVRGHSGYALFRSRG